ncbi:MAG: putative LPS assembly protein LptD [candidate division KSB1 bacterium]|nr:putative LPS assembly protein LptD [candidate division KSB1 bacterium]MDZ7303800.1 putative LPS assembly protein LptD [candidate division KSB1 bacterium]MDZ7313059.1 putative LPS assembly protein LptD [candidate division KSB1 bacterium]
MPIAIVSAQIPFKTDSLAVSKLDSLSPDPARADTLRPRSELDAPIDYQAQLIDNLVQERITYLIGKAVVKYKTMTLEAGRIMVDWNARSLIAEPLPDSLFANGEGSNGVNDSLAKVERGFPVFSDGGDRIVGERMEYNFATGKGRVVRGRTEFQDGKYFGAQIKRMDSNTLFVSNGTYSTCNREEHPHFHFWSRRMKIVLQQNVVAKPIVLFIGKIPLAALPFGFFPTRTGRRSGLIVPRYGASQLEGRYIKELGYYWAMSDYFDARATVDFYERSGWLADGEFRYAKRYAFSGGIRGSLTRKNFVLYDRKERNWRIAFDHNQRLGSTASLVASGSFQSSNDYNRFFGANRRDYLQRTLLSQATFSKSFSDGRNSLSLNFSEMKDLENGSFQRTLPQLSINFGQRQIFGSKESSKKMPVGSSKSEERAWYENFYYSLSSSAQNIYSKSTNGTKTEHRATANHSLYLSLSSPKRYFGWLTLNQSLPIQEDWFDRTTDYFVKPDSTIGSSEKKGFAARHLFSYSASAITKIYGTFQPHLGPVQALRHVVTPSIGFSYRPDFSDPLWGYFEQVRLPNGQIARRDRFGGTTGLGKQASMTMSVGNLFQMKTGPEDKPKKIDLFTLNFSSSHNFAAKQFKQADLSSNLYANPSQNISLSMSALHSFYDYDRSTGLPINRLLYKRNGIFSGQYVRLTNFNIGAYFRFQGSSGQAGPIGSERATESREEELPFAGRDRFGREEYFMDTAIPWQADFSLSINLNRSNPLHPTKTAQLTLGSLDLRLTKNWRVNVSGQFDLREKTFFDQRYSIYRDLHCWEMQVEWYPTGFRRGFYFRLNVKAPLLRDIKLERRGGRTSVFSGGSYYY